MSAKITQQDRETAVRITRAHKAPAHLVEEWKTHEAPLRPFLAELFQPLQDAAQALADAREAGYRQALQDLKASRYSASVDDILDAVERAVRDNVSLIELTEEHAKDRDPEKS